MKISKKHLYNFILSLCVLLLLCIIYNWLFLQEIKEGLDETSQELSTYVTKINKDISIINDAMENYMEKLKGQLEPIIASTRTAQDEKRNLDAQKSANELYCASLGHVLSLTTNIYTDVDNLYAYLDKRIYDASNNLTAEIDALNKLTKDANDLYASLVPPDIVKYTLTDQNPFNNTEIISENTAVQDEKTIITCVDGKKYDVWQDAHDTSLLRSTMVCQNNQNSYITTTLQKMNECSVIDSAVTKETKELPPVPIVVDINYVNELKKAFTVTDASYTFFLSHPVPQPDITDLNKLQTTIAGLTQKYSIVYPYPTQPEYNYNTSLTNIQIDTIILDNLNKQYLPIYQELIKWKPEATIKFENFLNVTETSISIQYSGNFEYVTISRNGNSLKNSTDNYNNNIFIDTGLLPNVAYTYVITAQYIGLSVSTVGSNVITQSTTTIPSIDKFSVITSLDGIKTYFSFSGAFTSAVIVSSPTDGTGPITHIGIGTQSSALVPIADRDYTHVITPMTGKDGTGQAGQSKYTSTSGTVISLESVMVIDEHSISLSYKGLHYDSVNIYNSSKTLLLNTTANSYIDKGLNSNTAYYYTIVPVGYGLISQNFAKTTNLITKPIVTYFNIDHANTTVNSTRFVFKGAFATGTISNGTGTGTTIIGNVGAYNDLTTNGTVDIPVNISIGDYNFTFTPYNSINVVGTALTTSTVGTTLSFVNTVVTENSVQMNYMGSNFDFVTISRNDTPVKNVADKYNLSSYLDVGLKPNTQYTYSIVSYKDLQPNNTDTGSFKQMVYTLPTVDTFTATLQTNPNDSNTVNVLFSFSGAFEYGMITGLSDKSKAITVSTRVTGTTFTYTGLDLNNWTWKFTPFNGDSVSGTVNTFATNGPARISNTAISVDDANSVTLSFANSSGNNNFLIKRGLKSNALTELKNNYQATTLVDTKLADNTTYFYEISALDAGGNINTLTNAGSIAMNITTHASIAGFSIGFSTNFTTVVAKFAGIYAYGTITTTSVNGTVNTTNINNTDTAITISNIPLMNCDHTLTVYNVDKSLSQISSVITTKPPTFTFTGFSAINATDLTMSFKTANSGKLVIFRTGNNNAIATITDGSISFKDTGILPNTTYTYIFRVYDTNQGDDFFIEYSDAVNYATKTVGSVSGFTATVDATNSSSVTFNAIGSYSGGIIYSGIGTQPSSYNSKHDYTTNPITDFVATNIYTHYFVPTGGVASSKVTTYPNPSIAFIGFSDITSSTLTLNYSGTYDYVSILRETVELTKNQTGTSFAISGLFSNTTYNFTIVAHNTGSNTATIQASYNTLPGMTDFAVTYITGNQYHFVPSGTYSYCNINSTLVLNGVYDTPNIASFINKTTAFDGIIYNIGNNPYLSIKSASDYFSHTIIPYSKGQIAGTQKTIRTILPSVIWTIDRTAVTTQSVTIGLNNIGDFNCDYVQIYRNDIYVNTAKKPSSGNIIYQDNDTNVLKPNTIYTYKLYAFYGTPATGGVGVVIDTLSVGIAIKTKPKIDSFNFTENLSDVTFTYTGSYDYVKIVSKATDGTVKYTFSKSVTSGAKMTVDDNNSPLNFVGTYTHEITPYNSITVNGSTMVYSGITIVSGSQTLANPSIGNFQAIPQSTTSILFKYTGNFDKIRIVSTNTTSQFSFTTMKDTAISTSEQTSGIILLPTPNTLIGTYNHVITPSLIGIDAKDTKTVTTTLGLPVVSAFTPTVNSPTSITFGYTGLFDSAVIVSTNQSNTGITFTTNIGNSTTGTTTITPPNNITLGGNFTHVITPSATFSATNFTYSGFPISATTGLTIPSVSNFGYVIDTPTNITFSFTAGTFNTATIVSTSDDGDTNKKFTTQVTSSASGSFVGTNGTVSLIGNFTHTIIPHNKSNGNDFDGTIVTVKSSLPNPVIYSFTATVNSPNSITFNYDKSKSSFKKAIIKSTKDNVTYIFTIRYDTETPMTFSKDDTGTSINLIGNFSHTITPVFTTTTSKDYYGDSLGSSVNLLNPTVVGFTATVNSPTSITFGYDTGKSQFEQAMIVSQGTDTGTNSNTGLQFTTVLSFGNAQNIITPTDTNGTSINLFGNFTHTITPKDTVNNQPYYGPSVSVSSVALSNPTVTGFNVTINSPTNITFYFTANTFKKATVTSKGQNNDTYTFQITDSSTGKQTFDTRDSNNFMLNLVGHFTHVILPANTAPNNTDYTGSSVGSTNAYALASGFSATINSQNSITFKYDTNNFDSATIISTGNGQTYTFIINSSTNGYAQGSTQFTGNDNSSPQKSLNFIGHFTHTITPKDNYNNVDYTGSAISSSSDLGVSSLTGFTATVIAVDKIQFNYDKNQFDGATIISSGNGQTYTFNVINSAEIGQGQSIFSTNDNSNPSKTLNFVGTFTHTLTPYRIMANNIKLTGSTLSSSTTIRTPSVSGFTTSVTANSVTFKFASYIFDTATIYSYINTNTNTNNPDYIFTINANNVQNNSVTFTTNDSSNPQKQLNLNGTFNYTITPYVTISQGNSAVGIAQKASSTIGVSGVDGFTATVNNRNQITFAISANSTIDGATITSSINGTIAYTFILTKSNFQNGGSFTFTDKDATGKTLDLVGNFTHQIVPYDTTLAGSSFGLGLGSTTAQAVQNITGFSATVNNEKSITFTFDKNTAYDGVTIYSTISGASNTTYTFTISNTDITNTNGGVVTKKFDNIDSKGASLKLIGNFTHQAVPFETPAYQSGVIMNGGSTNNTTSMTVSSVTNFSATINSQTSITFSFDGNPNYSGATIYSMKNDSTSPTYTFTLTAGECATGKRTFEGNDGVNNVTLNFVGNFTHQMVPYENTVLNSKMLGGSANKLTILASVSGFNASFIDNTQTKIRVKYVPNTFDTLKLEYHDNYVNIPISSNNPLTIQQGVTDILTPSNCTANTVIKLTPYYNNIPGIILDNQPIHYFNTFNSYEIIGYYIIYTFTNDNSISCSKDIPTAYILAVGGGGAGGISISSGPNYSGGSGGGGGGGVFMGVCKFAKNDALNITIGAGGTNKVDEIGWRCSIGKPTTLYANNNSYFQVQGGESGGSYWKDDSSTLQGTSCAGGSTGGTMNNTYPLSLIHNDPNNNAPYSTCNTNVFSQYKFNMNIGGRGNTNGNGGGGGGGGAGYSGDDGTDHIGAKGGDGIQWSFDSAYYGAGGGGGGAFNNITDQSKGGNGGGGSGGRGTITDSNNGPYNGSDATGYGCGGGGSSGYVDRGCIGNNRTSAIQQVQSGRQTVNKTVYTDHFVYETPKVAKGSQGIIKIAILI